MKREYRLRKGSEFDVAYQEGTVIGGPFVVMRVLPNQVGHTRWGFAVGKKLAPRATTRNRLRRLFREAVRTLPATASFDIVVTARRDALGLSFVELRSAIARGMKRAGIEAELV